MARNADTYRSARRNAYRARRVLPVWRLEGYADAMGLPLPHPSTRFEASQHYHPSFARAAHGDATGDLRRVA